MKDLKQSIAEIKAAYDIVDYIQQAGISLKQRGATYVGLCPFHNEKTPSMNVNSQFQNYRCFGCGENGDLISFVEKYEHLDFMEAVRRLAEDKNIAIDIESESTIDYKSLRACMKSIANFYVREFRKLDTSHPAKQEIINEKRGLGLKDYIYGYAPEGRNTLFNYLREQGFTEETILLTGACKKSEKTNVIRDFWQGRLMFVFTDISGRPIGFSGRKLYETDKMGKYVNSSDSVLFDKSSALFNISQAKKSASDNKMIYVAEGQFDVVALIKSGVENVVASSGTAFTKNQALMARRLVSEAGRIVFCFDGDSAGKQAAVKVFNNSPIIHSQSYAVAFPENVDPCDYRLKNGSEALASYVQEKQIPLVEFVMTIIAEKYDLTSSLDRSNYIQEVSKILATISNVPLRENYIRRVALDAFTPVEVVRDIVRAEIKNVENKTSNDETLINSSTENDSDTDETEESKTDSSVRSYEVRNDKDDLTHDESYIDYKDFVHFINTDSLYGAAARLLKIVLSDIRFCPAFLKNKEIMPVGFETIIADLEKISASDQKVMFPELFDRSDIIRYIMDSDLLSLAYKMDLSEMKIHFVNLTEHLKKNQNRDRVDYVRAGISKILSKTDDIEDPVSILKKALMKDKKISSIS